MNTAIIEKNYLNTNFAVFLIILLPISLLIGNFAANLNIILINIFFLKEIFKKNFFFFLKDRNFYFLIIIYIYLIINSILVSNNFEGVVRSAGFIRYIILAYAIFYYFITSRDKILKYWLIIYIIVSADVLIEHFTGSNIFGFSSEEPSRIASFTKDELIIGGYYFGFISICLLYLKTLNNIIFFLCTILFFYISIVIGERSNFLKLLVIYILYVTFFSKVDYYKKILILLLIIFSIFMLIKNSDILKSKFYYMIFPNIIETFNQNDENKVKNIIKKNEYFTLYNTAFLIFKENILFGVGNKNYRIDSFVIKQKDKEGIYGASTHPHQLHFELLSELGITGYLLIMSNLIILIIKNRKKTDFLKISSTLFILATLVPILPSGSFFSTFNASIFWINYAFLINIQHNDNS